MRKLSIVVFFALIAAAPSMFGQLARLTGDWRNANPASRGIVRVRVTATPGGANVQVWGSCTPTPCDWGVQPVLIYGPNVSANPIATARALTAVYRQGFKDVVVVLKPEGAAGMAGEFYSHFTPAGGRSDYVLFERFVRR